jgi:hypothetical protein
VAEEAARLDGAGQHEYAQAMRAFVAAVGHARSDSTALSSRDFRAIETWAGMLFSRGHWAHYLSDTTVDARYRYLGALAHYNLSPPEGPSSSGRHARQVWVGPRALVTVEGDDGYVADEIPATALGCPVSWKPFLLPGASDSERNLFAVRWVNPPGSEFLQVAKALRNVALRVAALAHAGRDRHDPDTHAAGSAGLHLPKVPAPVVRPPVPAHLTPQGAAPGDSAASAVDSLASVRRSAADSLHLGPAPDSAAVLGATR